MDNIIVNAIKEINMLKDQESIKIGDFDYIKNGYTKIVSPEIANIKVNSLDSMIEYINNNIDVHDFDACMVHVDNETSVKLISDIKKPSNKRDFYVHSICETSGFQFDTFMSQENFIISLHSMFLPEDDISYLLNIASNISVDASAKSVDNGHSQNVTLKVGVTTEGKEAVKPVVALRPIRTFREIELQPQSRFVFRVRQRDGEAKFALFEADGGAWKLAAMDKIKSYLKEKLTESNIKISII